MANARLRAGVVTSELMRQPLRKCCCFHMDYLNREYLFLI